MTGDDIRQARLRRGWTQETLARRLGITQSTVARVELGRRPITRRMEVQLRALFRELREHTEE